jgi:myxalamid-type nonribosomal peptide synthetase MxaA
MRMDSTAAKELLGTLSEDRAKLLSILLDEQSKQVQRINAYARDADAELPVSAAQQRMWLIDLEGGGSAYHIPVAVRLRGSLHQRALQRALDTLLQRHEVLRTVFVNRDGDPKAKLVDDHRFALQLVDLRGYEEAQREEQVRLHQNEEARAPFDLSVGPVIRGRLLELEAAEHVLLITVHHIVFDAWSMRVFARELAELYGAYSERHGNPLQPLPIQYADFAQWQREWSQGKELESQLDYWRGRLADAPELELPTDRPVPRVQSYRGETVNIALDSALSTRLRAFAQSHGMTLFMVSYAAWAILVSRLSGQEDVVIGTPVANRRQPELEGLIGFFVNTLVLRVNVNRSSRVDEFLAEIKRIASEAYDNQDVPFERVVEALQPVRSPGRNPLFQVMLVVQSVSEAELRLPGLNVSQEEAGSLPAKFDWLLSLEERGDEIVCGANYAADLFDRATLERWMACFILVLEGMTRELEGRVGDLEILPQDERRIIYSFNATAVVYPRHQLVHELFEEQVRYTPDAVALIYADDRLTYSELNRRANQLARILTAHGIGPGQLVGICAERTPEMVVGLLAILKAGGAYLPLDPSYPPERLQHMLQDAAPRIVLTQEKLRVSLPEASALVLTLDEQLQRGSADGERDIAAAELGLAAEHLVYVIYTSGSTGRPKGTAMPHGAMVNLICWQRSNLRSDGPQRVLQFAALSFDVAFQETFTTLCTGSTLVLLDEWIRRDAAALTEFLAGQRIQRLFIPPLMLQSVAEHITTTSASLGDLRDIITAGEQLRISPEIVDFAKRMNGCRLHNHYGPTETHVVTALTLVEDPKEWPVLPSIGRPIANTQIHILDVQRRHVPIGVAGEIYIGGAGVARGYLGRPELTAQRFVADPFSADPHARLYKTGDLGRWRIDGVIEYLGRNDDQVKIRGYRIELGEIEAQLAQHEQVKEAAVVARQNASGEKRLIAYVTSLDQRGPSFEELRTYLNGVLPNYMVPSAFVKLATLPLTPSGKLDRRALPEPEASAYVTREYEAPQGQTEENLARIWEEALPVGRVGRQDNFFELGGHSLLAAKMLFKVNQAFGSALRVTDIYRDPTLRSLAIRIGGVVKEDELINLSREAILDEEITAIPRIPQIPPKAVLLTGGTGFIGRFLLAQFLQDTQATIYCLVRAPTVDQAAARLKSTMMRWDLWRAEWEQRIVAVPGDLRLPRLGVDRVTYELLCQNIDSIVHCGTSMNHLETYAMAKAANVDAARELLKLATLQRPKLVNHISTLGIFRSDPSLASRMVSETSSIDQEKHWSSQGYVASKWVSEKIFMTAAERGIPCNIFRVGLVWPDTQQGRYDELQYGYRMLKSCLLSGYGIQNYRDEMTPTPVDFTARAIAFLANRLAKGLGIFHISSTNRKIERLFERCNEIAGTKLELKSFYDWIGELRRLHYAGRSLPAVPLLEFAFSMDEQSFLERRRLIQAAGTYYDCSRTHRELEQAGIVAPELDDALLKLLLESMLARDAELRHLSTRLSISS